MFQVDKRGARLVGARGHGLCNRQDGQQNDSECPARHHRGYPLLLGSSNLPCLQHLLRRSQAASSGIGDTASVGAEVGRRNIHEGGIPVPEAPLAD